MNKVFGSIVASAVAGFMVAAPALADHHEAAGAHDKAGTKDKKPAGFCQNNTCKGKSACKAHGNDTCKGQNECKGHGFLEAADAKACKTAGGKWMAGK